MTFEPPPVHLSSVDEERFGIRIARASVPALSALPFIMDFCRPNGVALLIARCPASELGTAQAMEREGFGLMDTLVYYAHKLEQTSSPSDVGKISIRPVRPGEEDGVKRVAAESLRGYFGHYHADERLGRQECDEVYTSWALRSCLSRDVADEVLVADLGGNIVGFATLRLN